MFTSDSLEWQLLAYEWSDRLIETFSFTEPRTEKVEITINLFGYEPMTFQSSLYRDGGTVGFTTLTAIGTVHKFHALRQSSKENRLANESLGDYVKRVLANGA